MRVLVQATQDTVVGNGQGLSHQEGRWFEDLVQVCHSVGKLRGAGERAQTEGEPVVNLGSGEDAATVKTQRLGLPRNASESINVEIGLYNQSVKLNFI